MLLQDKTIAESIKSVDKLPTNGQQEYLIEWFCYESFGYANIIPSVCYGQGLIGQKEEKNG